MIDDNNESLQLQHAPTILLRVRRQRRGAITAGSTTLRVELDAALAAADDAFNEWDINSYDENDHDHLGINQSTSDQDIITNNNNNNNGKIHSHRHRVSVSSRSRQSTTSTSTLTTTTTSTAIFRRIESSSLLSHDESVMNIKNSFNFNQHKRPRILDAVLLDDDDDDDSNHIDDRNEDAIFGSHNGSKNVNGGSKKRRRLTLQILEPQKVAEEQQRRRSSLLLQYPILSPQQRAIDDSLQQVFVGTVTLQQHCQLIHESAMVLQNEASDWYWPYVWCHADYGNWLHAAAIWNEANTVREMFHFLEEQLDQLQQSESGLSSRNHTYASLIREIIQTHNNEGLNPMQVAHLSSNSEVHAVLEHYYNIYNQDDDFINGDNMDDDDHQYELYSLVVENNDPGNCNNVSSDTNNAGQQLCEENDYDPLLVTSCELHNDCRGYWDERGNLILEAPGTTTALDLDLDHNEKTRGAIHPENLDMDDIDSNDEDWDGNDYPDDDDDKEFESDEDGSDNEDYHEFRRRHVNVFGSNHRNVVDCNYNYNDYDDDDAHYDPSYGDIYGQSDSLNR